MDYKRELMSSEKRESIIGSNILQSEKMLEAATGMDKKAGLVHNIEIKRDNRRLIKLNPIIKLQNII